MNRVKKQHFVPQFYLKYFVDTQNNIHVFDKVSQKQFSTTTANIAHDKLLYDYMPLEEIIGMEQAVERAFANTEGGAAEFFRKLIATLDTNNLSSLTRDDYRLLADYIITQERRTPEARKQIEEIAMRYGEELLESDIQFQQTYLLLHGDVLRVVEDWCDCIWVFWKNMTDSSFYTSDHPIGGHYHKDQQCYEIFFPITPKYGVSILLKDGLQQNIEKREIRAFTILEEVKHYNFLMITQSNRQIYSMSNNFEYVKELIKLNPILTDPNRPRFLNT